MRRPIRVGFWLVLALASACLFLTRYWIHRDCIAAARSSCTTADGANLTAGGMLWGPLAFVFLLAAALAARKR
ncbi:hypothetical protein NOF55_09595 [Rhizobiaceae bacterium BDR2-2]|uniref:Transmembrane protein n=1 Tax=Ectorhizobium quercum TaxID=2965071 RepID=A0AAE3SVV2_9HYPH|nr:hypothetical protein [Ectorhizobium quercum]MCX8997359.1 hypothetical protein [Ectorhizobium quercum]